MSHIKQLSITVEDVETAFYDALNRSDIDALMDLWAEDEEVVCIHPGTPRYVGLAAIRASWEAIFERGNIYVQPRLLVSTHNLLHATHNVIEEVRYPDNQEGNPDLHIVATNVYIKTPQGWRIVLHHASAAAGKMPVVQRKASMLH